VDDVPGILQAKILVDELKYDHAQGEHKGDGIAGYGGGNVVSFLKNPFLHACIFFNY
jgi:hypothetical protein